jgi:dTDP-glucose 4,6-dehydratase
VVGEREVDNFTMAKRIAEILDRPLKHRFEDFHATRPGHDRRYALDGRKLLETGWKPPVPLDASLEKAVRWTLAHPEWTK